MFFSPYLSLDAIFRGENGLLSQKNRIPGSIESCSRLWLFIINTEEQSKWRIEQSYLLAS
jgi:hypothetical protein